VTKPIKKKGHTKLMKGKTPAANAPAAKKTAAEEKAANEKRTSRAKPAKQPRKRVKQESFPGMEQAGVVEALSEKGLELIDAVEDMKESTKRVHDIQIQIDALGDEHGYKPGERYYDSDRDVWVQFGKIKRTKPKAGTSLSKATDEDMETEDTPIGSGTMAGRGSDDESEVHEDEHAEELAGAAH